MSYERSAPVYDVIYTDMKDYRREAERLHQIIGQYLTATGNNLLDVACGTGLHAESLQLHYNVEGADNSPRQLALAQARLPEMTFYNADMTDFELVKRYQIVTCLFSAIGHVDLETAVQEMAKHLVPGGVLIVESWIHPDVFIPGKISVNTVQRPDITVQRMTHATLRGDRISHLEMHHLVGRPGEGVEYFVEEHDTILYTHEEYIAAFRGAGLQVWHDPVGLMGRSLYIGRKASS